MVAEHLGNGNLPAYTEIGRCTVLGVTHIVTHHISGSKIAIPEEVAEEFDAASDVMQTIRTVAQESSQHKGYRNLQEYQRPNVGVRHVTNTPNTVGSYYGNTLYFTKTDPPIFIKAYDYAGPDIAVLQYAVMAALHQNLDVANADSSTKLHAPAQYALVENPDNKHRTIVMQGAAGEELDALLVRSYGSKDSSVDKIIMTAGVRQLRDKMKPILRTMLRHRTPFLLRHLVNDPFANLYVVQPDVTLLSDNPESLTEDAWKILDGATLLDQPFETPMARRLGRLAGINRLEQLLHPEKSFD